MLNPNYCTGDTRGKWPQHRPKLHIFAHKYIRNFKRIWWSREYATRLIQTRKTMADHQPPPYQTVDKEEEKALDPSHET